MMTTTKCDAGCDAANTGVCNCWQAERWQPAAIDFAAAARGAGALAYRIHGTTRALHLVVADAVRVTPVLAGHEPAIRAGWYAERAESATEPHQIGGGR